MCVCGCGCRNDHGVETRERCGLRDSTCSGPRWAEITLARFLCLMKRRSVHFKSRPPPGGLNEAKFCLVPYHARPDRRLDLVKLRPQWYSPVRTAFGVSALAVVSAWAKGIASPALVGRPARRREISTARVWCRDLSLPANTEHERAWASRLTHARWELLHIY